MVNEALVSALVLTNLFQFDCETNNVCLCKARSNLLLEPTSTKQ